MLGVFCWSHLNFSLLNPVNKLYGRPAGFVHIRMHFISFSPEEGRGCVCGGVVGGGGRKRAETAKRDKYKRKEGQEGARKKKERRKVS